MKILKLKPYFFRAFCDNPPIVFSEGLTIFYGGNGSGKSSLAEALEWLLYGFTKRRRKGDQYSRTEYKGSYVNGACPAGASPYVEAEIRLSDDFIHLLRRTIPLNNAGQPIDQESVLTIDGTQVEDFTAIGLSYTEAHCPVIVQHGIQDFIHTRPIDRYRAISEALGLADLIGFKDAIEKAKNQYRTNLPPEVSQARNGLGRLIARLTLVGLGDMATRWQNEDIALAPDFSVILNKARELLGSEAQADNEIPREVRKRQALEMSRVFDLGPFRPNPNLAAVFGQVDNASGLVQTNDGEFRNAAAKFAGEASSLYREAQLAFWRTGIDLMRSDSPELCPFCEQPTVTLDLIQDLKGRINADRDLAAHRKEVHETIDRLISSLSSLERTLQQLEYKSLADDHMAVLNGIFDRPEPRLEEFASRNRLGAFTLSHLRTRLTGARSVLSTIRSAIEQPTQVLSQIAALGDFPEQLVETATAAKEALTSYADSFNAFRPLLEKELSDEQTVAKFTALIDLFESRNLMDLVARARLFDNRILEVQRIADAHILAKQREVLLTREAEILTWYGRLSPNPDVRFSGLEPGRNEFNLRAEAFGRTLNAAATLSQSQLNCLGLSVYIPNVASPDSPFQFIVFDDPVQAMDDDHHEAFLLTVMPELLDGHQLQVIALTHLQPTADRLRNLNYHRVPLYCRFDKLQSDGPQIREYVPLREELKQVRDFAAGNETHRKMAVDRIRVLCEVLMREAHIKIKRADVPAQFLKADAKQLLTLFRTLPGVTPNQCQGLRDTIDWSDPSHHTDPLWQAPDTASINLHIDRLFGIISHHGLPT